MDDYQTTREWLQSLGVLPADEVIKSQETPRAEERARRRWGVHSTRTQDSEGS